MNWKLIWENMLRWGFLLLGLLILAICVFSVASAQVTTRNFEFEWDPPPAADVVDTFTLYSRVNGGTWAIVTDAIAGSEVSYCCVTLSQNTGTHGFTLTAVNSWAESPRSNEVEIVTVGPGAPKIRRVKRNPAPGLAARWLDTPGSAGGQGMTPDVPGRKARALPCPSGLASALCRDLGYVRVAGVPESLPLRKQ